MNVFHYKKINLLLTSFLFSYCIISPKTFAAALEEVIVSATKTAETFKADAVSQSTLSDTWIEDLYVDTFEELSFFVPGILIQEQSVNSAGYAIRGMTSNNSESTRTPRVSVWQDGMDISRSQGAYTAMYDIDHADIFKGPVTSLFGRGGQIGGINISNHFAEMKNSRSVSAEIGSFNNIKVNAMFNQKLTDSNAIRLALYNNQRDGYIENNDGSKLNSIDTQAARLSFTQKIKDTIFDFQSNVEIDTPTTIAFQSFEFPQKNPFENSTINDTNNLGIDRNIADVLAKITHSFNEHWDAESSFFYRDVKTDDTFDPDGTVLNLIQANESANYTTDETQIKLHYSNTQLTSTLGIDYFHEEVDVQFSAHINEKLAIRLPVIQSLDAINPFVSGIENDLFKSDGSPNPYFVIPLTSDRYEEQTESVDNSTFSIFLDNTYSFTNKFSVSFGLRLSQEKLYTQIFTPPANTNGQNTITTSFGIGNLILQPIDPLIPLSSAKDKFSGASGRLSLNYAISKSVSTFATYARGRRPDILNYTEQSALEHLVDETVDSYETGIHVDIAETYSTFDISAYMYDFKHFATSSSGVAALSIKSDDNASATVQGLEAAYTQFFNNDYLLFSNLTYNDALFNESAIIQGKNRFRYAPLWSGAFSLSKELKLNMQWTSRLTFQESFQSEIFFEDDNASNNGKNRQGGYGLMNIYFDFIFKKNLKFNVFVKNAADKHYIIDAGNFGELFGMPTFVPAIGRNIGAGFNFDF